jgi:hypothetical protein
MNHPHEPRSSEFASALVSPGTQNAALSRLEIEWLTLLDSSQDHSSSLSSSSSESSSSVTAGAAAFLAGFFFFFLFLLFGAVGLVSGRSRISSTSLSSIFFSDVTVLRSNGGGAAKRMRPFLVMAVTFWLVALRKGRPVRTYR